jgi:hypothetical protein
MSGSSRFSQLAEAGEIERRLQALENGLNAAGARAATSARDTAENLGDAIASALTGRADRFRQGASTVGDQSSGLGRDAARLGTVAINRIARSSLVTEWGMFDWGVALSGERMFDYIAFCNDLRRLRVASDSACNRFLGGAIIIILNLFVVGCIPMNEHADTDEEVIRLIPRNDALCHAVSDRLSDSMLSWAEHLHRLFSGFNRHLIEHYGCRLDHQVRGYHRQ